MNDNYVEIDLLDLCKTVLKKWKIIIICALAFAILGGAYGALQANKAKPETEEQIKALTAGMTQEEIDDVKDAAEIINNYRAMYKTQKDYNENSIYQNLNPYSVDALKLSYYIDNHYKVSYPVIEESNNLIPIIQAYISSFSEDAFYEELAKAVGEEGNPTYVKELVNIDTEEKDAGVLTITIYASSNDSLVKMGDFIKAAIIEKQSEIADVYGDHDIILASESAGKIVDTRMAEAQSKNVERLTTITINIANEEKLFTGNQLTFLKYLIHEELDEKVSVPKYVILGLFVGSLLTAVFYCIKYVLSGTVKTENELARLLGTSSLGEISKNVDLVTSVINNSASFNGCTSIAVISDSDSDTLQKMVKSLPNAVLAVDIINNKEAFEKFVKCDGVVFAEKLKGSSRKRLIKNKEMCSFANKKILGFVTE